MKENKITVSSLVATLEEDSFCGDVESTIKLLERYSEEAIESGFQRAIIKLETYYESPSSFRVFYEREETDEEYEIRQEISHKAKIESALKKKAKLEERLDKLVKECEDLKKRMSKPSNV